MRAVISLLFSVAVVMVQVMAVASPILATSESAPLLQTPAIDPGVLEAIYRQEPVLSESFTRDQGDWTTEESGGVERFFADRAYHFRATKPGTVAWAPANTPLVDFLAEVEITHAAGPLTGGASLLFRHEDGNNFYRFIIDGEGFYSLLKMQDGVWKTLIDWTEAAALETGEGAINLVGVLAEGPSITLFANGEALATVEDDSFSEGDFALGASAYNDAGVEIVFDDLTLWDLTQKVSIEPEEEELVAPEPEDESAGETPAFDLSILEAIYAEEPVLSESFTRDRGEWDTEATEVVERFYAGRAYHVKILEAGKIGWAEANTPLADFLIEVETTHVSGPLEGGARLLFRYEDGNNFYQYSIDGDGFYSLFKMLDGEWETLIGRTEAAVLGTGEGVSRLLGVLAQGSSITLFANGEALATITDDSFAQGDFALAAGTIDDPDVEIAFDELTIWELTQKAGTEAVDDPAAIDLAVLEAIYAQEPMLSESFTRDQGEWDTEDTEDVERFYADKTYHFKIGEPEIAGWTLAHTSLADFLVEVETTHVSGPLGGGASLLFRYEDGENFYRFSIDGEGFYSLSAMSGGEWESLIGWTEDAVLEKGQGASNLLSVLAEGSSITLFANGVALATIEDDSFAQGDVALGAGTYADPDVEIAFDDLMIWDLMQQARIEAEEEEAVEPELVDDTPAFDLALLDVIYAQEPVLSESFTRDLGNWGTEDTEAVERFYAGRAYHLKVLESDTVAWTQADTPLADFLVEVVATHVAGPLQGYSSLLFRYEDSDNFYSFDIDGRGAYALYKKVDGEWVALVGLTESPALEAGEGATNLLGVLAEGSNITLLANGTVLESVEDDSLNDGDFALEAGTYDDAGVEIAFDDLTIWDLTQAPRIESGEEEVTAPEAPAFDLASLDVIYALEPVLNESFTRDRGDWDTEDDEDIERFYDGQTYHTKILEPDTLGWARAHTPLADFLVEVETTHVSGPPQGYSSLLFRYEDSDNFYSFDIDGQGAYALYKKVGGEWAVLIGLTESPALEAGEGATNLLGVLAEGSNITLLANDTVLESVEDISLASGDFALAAGTYDDAGVEIAFDDLTIWDLAPIAGQLK